MYNAEPDKGILANTLAMVNDIGKIGEDLQTMSGDNVLPDKGFHSTISPTTIPNPAVRPPSGR